MQQRRVFSQRGLIEPVHEILVLIVNAQKPPLNTHYDVSSEAILLNFGLSYNLHPYVVYASGEGSGEPVRMHRLV